MRQAVFLDRDGVLNKAVVRDGRPYPPANASELEILSGVADTLVRLREAGYLLIVVTNQPDVGSGKTDRRTVEEIHARLNSALPLDDIRVCYCPSSSDCANRKPKPGMLMSAARDWDIDLGASHMVGDRWRDIGAGRAAGCRTYFVDFGYAEPGPEEPDFVVTDLADAGRIILNR